MDVEPHHTLCGKKAYPPVQLEEEVSWSPDQNTNKVLVILKSVIEKWGGCQALVFPSNHILVLVRGTIELYLEPVAFTFVFQTRRARVLTPEGRGDELIVRINNGYPGYPFIKDGDLDFNPQILQLESSFIVTFPPGLIERNLRPRVDLLIT